MNWRLTLMALFFHVTVARAEILPSDPDFHGFTKLAWEDRDPGYREWSLFLFRHIHEEAKALVASLPEDAHLFCPRYAHLNRDERIQFWAILVGALARYESNYVPSARYVEPGMGIDRVTGLPIVSEGLLQMSYQDSLFHPFCHFSWVQDQNLAPTDPRKTIFGVEANLQCGVGILQKQILRSHRIAVDRGAYWAVLKSNNSRNRITRIRQITKTLAACEKAPPSLEP